MGVVLILATGWALFALLGAPPARARLLRLPPIQAAGAFLAIAVGLVLLPIAALMVSLSAALSALGGSGSAFTRCGRLVAALVHQPLARPDIALVLVLLAVMLGRLGLAAVAVWRSQCQTSGLIRAASASRVIIESSTPVAFTAGLIRPRVVVSRTFLDQVPEPWQRAVMAHEEAHRKGRHPLLVFVAEWMHRTLPCSFTRAAADGVRFGLEERADDIAAKSLGSRREVAEAVAGLALIPVPGSVGFESYEVLRVRRLLEAPSSDRRTTGAAILIAAGAILIFASGHAVHCASASAHVLDVAQCRMSML